MIVFTGIKVVLMEDVVVFSGIEVFVTENVVVFIGTEVVVLVLYVMTDVFAVTDE